MPISRPSVSPETVELAERRFGTYRFNTIVVGTGAAGYNAADSLCAEGMPADDVAIVTEGRLMGTSRNTGSDKQTYYRLTAAGGEPDSVLDMAQTLFEGGSMHGDAALVEAALSSRCFYKLVQIGVPFPHNRYGEYVGYKTDHDPKQRATSCGPLTSRYMTERLEARVMERGIPIFDGFRVLAVVTESGEPRKACGLIALDVNSWTASRPAPELVLFNCTNVIWATGGPSAIYHSSVYPESQTCAMGTALEAGAPGVNLTESQYGIASTKFRWNLSGTYQQVVPMYVSADEKGGDRREFLDEYFATPREMTRGIFLKGYQWPFDPGKLGRGGSSLVDLAVFIEKRKGRRVFLDYRENPSALRGSTKDAFRGGLDGETYSYLERSSALQNTPIERLRHMNPPAYKLYLDNGIDLSEEMLEIAVCAQHNNGGLKVNIWWESDLKHFFPVGEAAGTLGVHRPGGSALNSTQTGSARAAQFIAANYGAPPVPTKEFLEMASRPVADILARIRKILTRPETEDSIEDPMETRVRAQKLMDSCGAFIRPAKKVEEAAETIRRTFASFEDRRRAQDMKGLLAALIDRDILLTQYTYLSAIAEYIGRGGRSRGSSLICGEGELEDLDIENCAFSGIPASLDGGNFMDKVCEVRLEWNTDGLPACRFDWTKVRPIPEDREDWFENIYNAWLRGEITR
ncbi:MAG: FAD-binding protein [Synergistaceae bacterium]|jgi:succinate dehydrogenase/fumarate reductase flavoprotein subunit|nr:FAD-binding protein [Synergistaceae bacterium]